MSHAAPPCLLHGAVQGTLPPQSRVGYGAALRVDGQPADRATLRDPDLARQVLRRAVAEGAMLLDTADSYGPALSEELVAEALHPYPAGLLLATKGGVQRLGAAGTRLNGRPAHLRAACEASLRRLRVEAIGLYQLHWPDPEVPWAEQIGALAALRQAGLVREIGLCNVTAAELRAAVRLAPIAAVQGRFGLADQAGAGLAAACAELGVAFIAYGSLAVLRQPAARAALAAAAGPHGATAAQLALAGVLASAPRALAVPGTLRLGHLLENMAAHRLIPGEAQAATLAGLVAAAAA